MIALVHTVVVSQDPTSPFYRTIYTYTRDESFQEIPWNQEILK